MAGNTKAAREPMLPCPKCDTQPARSASQGFFYIGCGHCGCMASHAFKSEEAAEIAWNRRITRAAPQPEGVTITEAQRREIAEARKAGFEAGMEAAAKKVTDIGGYGSGPLARMILELGWADDAFRRGHQQGAEAMRRAVRKLVRESKGEAATRAMPSPIWQKMEATFDATERAVAALPLPEPKP